MRKKKNKHIIKVFWRGDNEDTKSYAFPTREDAWSFVLGKIRKTLRVLSRDGNYQKAEINLDEVKNKLFNEGFVAVNYNQIGSDFDNWFYYDET